MKLTTKSTDTISDGSGEKNEGIPPDVLARLLALLSVKKVRQVDFAKSMGRSKDWASRTMKGERGLSVTTLLKLVVLFGVDVHWLLTGEGAMFRSSTGSALGKQEIVDDLIVRLQKLRSLIGEPTKPTAARKLKKE